MTSFTIEMFSSEGSALFCWVCGWFLLCSLFVVVFGIVGLIFSSHIEFCVVMSYNVAIWYLYIQEGTHFEFLLGYWQLWGFSCFPLSPVLYLKIGHYHFQILIFSPFMIISWSHWTQFNLYSWNRIINQPKNQSYNCSELQGLFKWK